MEKFNKMKKIANPKDRLIFALDVPAWSAALPLVESLRTQVGCFKLGLELFISQGPSAVKELRALAGQDVALFLDLKLHDIPATVGRAAAVVASLGVDMFTVHASGGPAMIETAKKRAGAAKVLAVTVLTSIDPVQVSEIRPELREPGALVLDRAKEALEAGCDGFVCSGREAKLLRDELGPNPLIITPGIRPAWTLVEGDDQARVVTPAKAIADGADMIVVGRPIRDALDPAAAASKVAQEMA